MEKKRLGNDVIPVVLVKGENIFGLYDSVRGSGSENKNYLIYLDR